MRKNKKKWGFCIGLAAVLLLACGMSAARLEVVRAAVNADPPVKAVVVERQTAAAIEGANYALAKVEVSFDDAPQLKGSQAYWGVRVRNMLSSPANVRLGFSMGGGVTMWMHTYVTSVLQWIDGRTETFTPSASAGQKVMIPANFDGTVYLPKASLINYPTNPSDMNNAVVKNGFRAKGVVWGYDYRQTYGAKIALYGLSVADFREAGGGKLSLKEQAFVTNFDAATFGEVNCQGTLSDEIRAQMTEDLARYSIDVSTFDHPVSIEVAKLPDRTQYEVYSAASYVGGVVSISYTAEADAAVTEQYALTDARFELSGFRSDVPTDALPVTVGLKGTSLTVTFNVRIVDYVPQPAAAATKAVIVERKSSEKIADGNYALASVMTAFDAAPQLKGTAAYWGVRVQNLTAQPARVRYAFEMGGGGLCWIGPAGTINYFVSTDGTVTAYELDSAQYVEIPAFFDGTVYTPKAACYGYPADPTDASNAIVKNGFRVKGVQWGYDYRSTYTAKLALYGVGSANITVGEDDAIEVTDAIFAGNFDAVPQPAVKFLGTPSEAAQAAMLADFDSRIVDLSLLEHPASVTLTATPKTRYVVNEAIDLSDGVVEVTYALSGEEAETPVSETIAYPLDSALFEITGFDSSTPVERQTLTATLKGTELSVSFDINVSDPDVQVKSISIVKLPKITYKVGEEADWSDGQVELTYSSGRTETKSMSDAAFVVTGFSSANVAWQLRITVTLAADPSISASFTASVESAAQSDEQPKGCGCGSALGGGIAGIALLPAGLAALLLARRRRRHG